MKGIVLAGGKGTRLRPFTYIIKKELLPVYDKPLIFYPLNTLKQSGITEAIIVVDPKSVGAFTDIIGHGAQLGMKITYTIQNEPLGMAHALLQARHLVKERETVFVIGGDDVFSEDFGQVTQAFISGAMIVVTKVPDPERYGVVYFNGNKVTRIEEKPTHPKSPWIQAGIYIYDARVFDIIERLKPSSRGEYEITDISNAYIKMGQMGYQKTKGRWFDAGTFDSLLEASIFMARQKRKNGAKAS